MTTLTNQRLAGALLLLAIAMPCSAEETTATSDPQPAAKREVTIDTLLGLLEEASVPAKRHETNRNMLVLEYNGIKSFIVYNEEKKIVSYVALVRLPENVTEEAKLRFVNKLNNKLLLVRFSLTKPAPTQPDCLWCDYQIPCETTADQLISACRVFHEIVGIAIRASSDLGTKTGSGTGSRNEKPADEEKALEKQEGKPDEGLLLV